MDSSAKKKIVLIPTWYPSPARPVQGTFVREQAECLAERFDVTVLTPRFPRIGELTSLRWGPELMRSHDRGVKTWRVRKFKIPTLRRFFPYFVDPDHVFVYYRKFGSALRRGFHRYVLEHGLPDVLHAHVVLPAGMIALELGQQYGVPVVITEHSGPFSDLLVSERQRRAVRGVLQGASRVIAVSSALRAQMNSFCPDIRIDVIGNVIDTDFFLPAPRKTPARYSFFFLGLMTEGKGVQYLLDAARILVTRGFTNFELRLGGEGPYRRPLEKMVAQHRLHGHCKFLGMLDRDEVRKEMCAADVFVLPSLGETFGVVIGEAMSCGRPVLATHCGGPEDLVTSDTGVLVKPADAEAFADAMAGFMTGRFRFREELIRNTVIQQFGRRSFLSKMAAIYAETLETHETCRSETSSAEVDSEDLLHLHL